MLEVLTTEEFAAWYAALSDHDAEEVATALDVIARLGPDMAAPDSSEWMLWYENAAFSRGFAGSRIDGIVIFGSVARQMLAHFEAPSFRKRLLAATPSQARAVDVALHTLRKAAGLNRRAAFVAAARALSESAGSAEQAVAKLQRNCREALAALGFEAGDLPEHSTALRELTLRECSPRIRLLYGVDIRRAIALAVLGEPLDRDYYGPSVRRAEAAWQQFIAGERTGRAPLRAP
jgi:hypothetical protein